MNLTGITIGKLAQQAGVGVETIRYYQRRGLLPAPQTPPGSGVRRYGEEELARLTFIRKAQAVGFSLEEIAELLALDEESDQEKARALARRKISEIEQRIGRLSAMKAALAELVGCCERAGGKAPCPILHAFSEG